MARKRLTMKKIREVIRLKYEAGLSNRAIAGACKISNSTVGEYLKRIETAGIRWPLGDIGEKELLEKIFPENETNKPKPKIPIPNWEKVKTERRRKGVTLQLIWDDYKSEHPDGYEYSQFCEHYRRWKKSMEEPSMHKDHKGGEDMEVDYAGMKISMTDPESGEIVQLSVFVATLPASNYIYAEAQLCETQKNWINGHVRAFEYFGGVPKIIIPDNLRTGITKPNYYEPGVNHSYQELAEHYHFAVLPARVKRPKDKPSVENGVQNVERWIIAPLRDRKLFGLGEVKKAINEQLEYLNNRIMKGVGHTRRQEFEDIDLPNLLPLPERPYEFAEWKTATVHIDYHVEFEHHLYSVAFTLIHQKVDIRATEKAVQIYHQGKIIAIHPRNNRRGRYSTQHDHMPANHQFMKGINSDSLVDWAEKIGPNTSTLIKATLQSRPYPQQAYRTCLGILGLTKKHKLADVEAACLIAFEAKTYSYKVVQQELAFLQTQSTAIPMESLPDHANIRGAEYYQERNVL